MPFDVPTICALLSLIALVFLPGWALLEVIGSKSGDIFVRFGFAAGLGLAAQPLVALWARFLRLPMREETIWALLAVCAVVLLWKRRRQLKGLVLASDQTLAELADADPDGSHATSAEGDLADSGGSSAASALDRAAGLALIGLLIVLLIARWASAYDLRVPLWGDSVHHSMIARLFTLQQGLPLDWMPFEPLSPFTYHFGLHALTAGVSQLSGLAEHRSLIVVGQSLMVLQALTAYALAAGLTGRRWAGVGAAIVAAGLGPMPGQYINWGRYTQLAGHVILPVAALALAKSGAGKGEEGRRDVALAAVLVAGLALTHYLVTVFLVVFGVVWLLVGEGQERSWLRSRARRTGRLALVGVSALLLASPWIPQFIAGRLDEHATALLTSELPDPGVYGVVDPVWVWDQLGDFVGFGIVAAALLAGAVALIRRERSALLGLAWALALVAAAYPWVFGLPITGVLKDFAVMIGLYVPLGLLIGSALSDGVEWVIGRFGARESGVGTFATSVATIIAVGLVAVLHIAGPTRTKIDPGAVYASPADERAFEWIRENTPPNAVFLVSAGPAYAGTVVAGDDGGWWVPQLAERRTTLPPIIYGLEPSVEPGYREAVNALNARWRDHLDAPETREALLNARIGWAYDGPRPGVLDGDLLVESGAWEVAFEQDGARVFRAMWEDELAESDG